MTLRWRERLRTANAARSAIPPIVVAMGDSLDVDAMLERFRERARAARNRPLPPVEGAERKRFIERAQQDFMDFAMIGDAEGDYADGVLTLRIHLK